MESISSPIKFKVFLVLTIILLAAAVLFLMVAILSSEQGLSLDFQYGECTLAETTKKIVEG